MADAAKDDTGMRKAIFLPRSVWDRIADFRFAHRYKTEAEAVRQLLLDGLKANQPPRARLPPGPSAVRPAAAVEDGAGCVG